MIMKSKKHYTSDGATIVHSLLPELTRQGYMVIRGEEEIVVFEGSLEGLLANDSSLKAKCVFRRTFGDLGCELSKKVYEADVEQGSKLDGVLSQYLK